MSGPQVEYVDLGDLPTCDPLTGVCSLPPGPGCHTEAMATLHDFKATSIDGEEVDLASYAGTVVLVVNTASQCGLTPQYSGLQRLHDEYAARGFAVLGFPCNQFAGQEPGDEAEIAAFCDRTFGVTFPMFSKIDVSGEDAHPLYRWLQGEHDGLPVREVRWNFAKYLVGRDGRVVAFFAPTDEPETLTDAIEGALGA